MSLPTIRPPFLLNRITGMLLAVAVPLLGLGQGGDQQLRAKADGLFAAGQYAEAYPLYSQLVSLTPGDRDLNYRFGACTLYGGDDKEKAIGHLRFACESPTIAPLAHYFLGRSYHLAYRFNEALAAYERFKGTADKKILAQFPVDALEQQCRNGQQLLSNLKDIDVHSKLEVDASEFFRFYDLSGIGGRIVVTPDELRTSLDKKAGARSLIYLPEKGGPIYFSSLGKDGRTGKDIYRTELLPTGQFAEPTKLAGYVNTDQDEDYPFLTAEGKYFYFASKGHNSMGGYDVFRASYDKGLDVFGAPENLDFAVNTPDDDILYMVDPEGREACFASGRSSHQGKLHVYRVSTTQTPVNITVLKGTFASELDASDRKAHITVEDAMTRERVAEVRTDMNGNYVLALPRSGRYRFMVEAGPGGRTHVGYVEVPRSDAPRAYRQEMSLVAQADQEKLTIRNYFDEPLSEDLIALALDEIKRRAQLDVGTTTVVAQQPPPAATGDVMTQAGFTGDVTKEAAVELARNDAAELDRQAADLKAMSDAAYSIALENAAASERLATEANSLVAQASSTTDETQRNALMTEAARKRQASRMANLRARSAYTTGQDLDKDHMATAQRAAQASKLATDLGTAVKANDDQRALKELTALKTRLDEKNGPDGSLTAAEKARRAATEVDKEGARAVQAAQSKSAEESELVDRINRLKREQAGAGARSKKEELGREIAQYEEQLGYLREEVATAVAHSKAAEERSAVAKGEAQLTRYLSNEGRALPTTELDKERVGALGQKIAGNDTRIASIAVDERYDADIAEETRAASARTFDWGGTSTVDLMAATQTATRTNTGAGTEAGGGATTTQQATGGAGQDRPVTDGSAGAGGELAVTSGQQASEQTQGGVELNATERPSTPQGGAGTAQPAGTTNAALANDGGKTAAGTSDAGAALLAAGAGGERAVNGGQENAPPTGTGTTGEQVAARTGEEIVSMRGVGDVADGSGEQAFMQANELAELKQLRQAERDRARRDSLDQRITALEQRMASTAQQAATAQEPSSPEEPPDGAARSFEAAAGSEVIERMLFPDYPEDRARIGSATLTAQQRTQGLHGLELMLMDSIDAETTRQLNLLEAEPGRAGEVLPRVDRLRRLKEEHASRAEAILAGNDQQYATTETRALEQQVQAGVDAKHVEQQEAGAERPSTTSHVDRYVSVPESPEYIYESVVEHRAPAVKSAVAEKDRDLERIVVLGDEIDSLETVLESMPRGKEYDKLRDRTDRKIDEEMVLRTELGQRMAYISREEYKAGRDSLQRVVAGVSAKGIPPSDPLVLLAGELDRSARAQFDAAQAKRRQADRLEDIVKRDDLYRQAYQEELLALRDLDKAITVNNYVLSAQHVTGESLDYAQVEQRLFGTADNGDVAVSGGLTETGVASLPPDSAKALAARERLADLSRYNAFLGEENGQVSPSEMRSLDVSALALDGRQAREEAQRLEQRSVALSDLALAKRDSVATAKRRDKERLEKESVRLQLDSDSLHQASLAMERKAQELELLQRNAEEARAFEERLKKYYYLGTEDQLMVMSETDHSRYFMARTRSMEQQQQADLARQEAVASKQLADTLLVQATSLLAAPDLPDGRVSEQRLAQAKRLNDRAVELNQRADSLSGAAQRLKSAGELNDRQAAVLLQGMAPERSTGIMALEQRSRRTDPLIAESRALIAQVDSIKARELALAQAQGRATQRPVDAAVQQPGGDGGRTTASTERPAGTTTAQAPRTGADTGSSGERPVDAAGRPTPEPVPPPAGAFVAPEVLENDIFGVRPAGSAVQPIAIDQPMPKGVVFKVQIGAFKNEIPKELFNDLGPVTGETTANGVVRYSAGLFTTPEAAERARTIVRERGYRDAFVVAYEEGRRVPLAQAVRAMQPLPATAVVQQPAPDRPAAVIQAPTTAVQPVDEAQVLASYPATAEELLKQFAPPADAASYYNVPGAAPARQVETVKGLFFTVQVGVYSKPTALDKLFNITPLNSERTETGKIRYTTGVFLDLDKARGRKDEAVVLGVKDAFITAYLNGKRIPMRDARALLQKFGPSVLADPSIATP